jgi:competence protein ComEA
MDRIAEWRPVDPAGPDGTADKNAGEEPAAEESAADTAPVPRAAATSWRLVGPVLVGLSLAGLAIAAAIALLVLSSMPKPAVAIDAAGTSEPSPDTSGGLAPGRSDPTAAAEFVVDVEGAVENPGAWRLPSGSRVGDAIRAAGGYSEQVDIDAASRQLNLAEAVADGQQIHVPLRGEADTADANTSDNGSEATPGASPGSGLIDVNHASEEELDTLPGIGPVTAAKITAARQEASFASIDELLQRGVVGQATFDKIRPLITVAP